jgi:Holliday junction resolvase RusA-like endonuclease
MGKKRKFKTLKNKLLDYNSIYNNIPKDDPVERIMYCLGDRLDVKKVQSIINKKKAILANRSYSYIKLVMYQTPSGSERPRLRRFGGMVSTYVPNAKETKEYFRDFIKKFKKDIKIIHTPIYIKCNSYHPMPDTATVEEQVLFEAKLLPPVTKPDFDNVIKTYTDMMIEVLILDDDLIYKANIEKFYSLLPRLEIWLYYEDSFTSKYVYNKIKGRKTFKRLADNIEISKLIK